MGWNNILLQREPPPAADREHGANDSLVLCLSCNFFTFISLSLLHTHAHTHTCLDGCLLTHLSLHLSLSRSSLPHIHLPHRRRGSVSALLHKLLPPGPPREPAAGGGRDPVQLSPLPHPHRRLLLHPGRCGRGRGGVPRFQEVSRKGGGRRLRRNNIIRDGQRTAMFWCQCRTSPRAEIGKKKRSKREFHTAFPRNIPTQVGVASNPRRLWDFQNVDPSDGVPQVEQLQTEQAGGDQQPDGDSGGREAAQRQRDLCGHPEPAGAAPAAPAGPGRGPGPGPAATRPGTDRSVHTLLSGKHLS